LKPTVAAAFGRSSGVRGLTPVRGQIERVHQVPTHACTAARASRDLG